MSLTSLERISIAFGHLPLLDRVDFQIDRGERVSIIGRNGTGKSTLLKLLSGDQVPDAGSMWTTPNLRVARLDQDVPLSAARTVFDVVADGLGDLSALVADYHHAATELAETGSAALLERVGRLQHELDERDAWRVEERVELVLSRLSLPADVVVDTLSGGWRRRVLLAKALVAEPDILLLDEPTNHLDLDAILWLESFLSEYPGSVVFVTHDRAFLQRIATRIVEIDRGRLTSWPGDYTTFLRKKEEWLANEAVREEKFDKRLAEEEVWLRQGVKARRTRNEGRVRALMAMREERAARRTQAGVARLHIERAQASGQLVFEVTDISKSFGAKCVVQNFSARIMRGDRIGLIGPNGSGKTTLLRMILGSLPPDEGEVRHGANVEVAYYDQQREQLDPERTVFDTLGDGNDTVTVNGRTRHVNAYLADFLFPPQRAQSPVKSLSGGERNRLLLARLFTRVANVLVLDEPTNDLDLETLELLEAQLVEWPGTLLLVSHDRAFLDNVITSTFVFEGDGRVQEYVGGYEDWLRQRNAARASVRALDARATSTVLEGRQVGPTLTQVGPTFPPTPRLRRAGRSGATKSPSKKPGSPVDGTPAKKLSYREQQELLGLPARIEALEAEQRAISEAIAAPGFYKELAATIAATLAREGAIERELTDLYARWDALDSRTK